MLFQDVFDVPMKKQLMNHFAQFATLDSSQLGIKKLVLNVKMIGRFTVRRKTNVSLVMNFSPSVEDVLLWMENSFVMNVLDPHSSWNLLMRF